MYVTITAFCGFWDKVPADWIFADINMSAWRRHRGRGGTTYSHFCGLYPTGGYNAILLPVQLVCY